MGHLIWTALVGLVVGYIARFFHPGKDSFGMIMTAVLGIAGSFLAQYAGAAIGWYKQGETSGFIASVLGAIVLMVIYGFVKSKTDSTST
jgi:uncharacterized membrane protein YeaQ/YmgE (transglycosylase-associated protein family)